MRVIVTNPSGDILGTFNSFVILHTLIEQYLTKLGSGFQKTDNLGYLSSNLSTLGTGMRLSVMVYLPSFNALISSVSSVHNHTPFTYSALTLLEDVCALFNLTSRGTNGVNTPAEGDKFDICNLE